MTSRTQRIIGYTVGMGNEYHSYQHSQVDMIFLCLGDGIVTKSLSMQKLIEEKEELGFRLVESEGPVRTANRKYPANV